MKILKMVLLIIVATIAVVTIFVAIYLNRAPQVGGTPQGERLERMNQSPNYKDGKFQNIVLTEMKFPGFGTMMEFFFNNTKREPEDKIITHDFDKSNYKNGNDSSILVTWFGHSSLLLEVSGTTILIDPVFSERASMFTFMGPKRFNYSSYASVKNMPKIDAVLISHDHYDHLDYETFLELNGVVDKFYVPLSVGAHLESWGVDPENIIELDWWEESVYSDSLKLIFTPSRHFSGRALNDRYHTLWGSWVIDTGDKKIFFGGDSGYFNGFKTIGEKYGPFDFAMLECGQYNEKWKSIHMMPEETAQAGVDLNAAHVMPIHWGKFNLSLHPWKEPVQRFLTAARDKDFTTILPEVGKTFTIRSSPKVLWWEKYR